MASLVSIKLSSTNFLLWKSQAYPLIRNAQLLHHLEEEAPVQTIIKDGNEMGNPEYDVWLSNDGLLTSWILGTMNEESLSLVVGCESALQIWRCLEEHYLASSKESELHLKGQLATKRGDGESLDDFIRKFKRTCDNLAVIRKLVADLDKVFQLSRVVGTRYQPYNIAFLSKAPYPTFNQYTASLLNNERDLQVQEQEHKSQVSTYTHVFMAQRGRGQRGRGYGGKFDHAYQSEELPQALATITLEDDKDQTFYADTGASDHMTSGIAFLNYLAECGIQQQVSCPGTPEQNGVAERKHRHITETGLTMLFHANMPLRCLVAGVFLIFATMQLINSSQDLTNISKNVDTDGELCKYPDSDGWLQAVSHLQPSKDIDDVPSISTLPQQFTDLTSEEEHSQLAIDKISAIPSVNEDETSQQSQGNGTIRTTENNNSPMLAPTEENQREPVPEDQGNEIQYQRSQEQSRNPKSESFHRLLHKKDGNRAEWEYPFAVAGINISFMLVQMLDLQSGRPSSDAGIRFLELIKEDPLTFDHLYCVAFQMMDAQWLTKRASYMEFNDVLKSTRTELEHELALEDISTVKDLPA
ncbi:hypothetical protein SLEP1_g19392 [Rubroshorea leprosula]|nr:hypothetical protein SLEP1_g19392 [Rubroshorea leprosula]